MIGKGVQLGMPSRKVKEIGSGAQAGTRPGWQSWCAIKLGGVDKFHNATVAL
jgi:hypothetical protein